MKKLQMHKIKMIKIQNKGEIDLSKELMVPQKDNIFTKIKKFFSKLFSNYSDNLENRSNVENTQVDKVDNTAFTEGIKKNISDENVFDTLNKDNFVEEVEKNEGILEMLSLDRLKKLEKYYEERVNSKKEYLKKLQSNV